MSYFLLPLRLTDTEQKQNERLLGGTLSLGPAACRDFHTEDRFTVADVSF
jgi:hypothetical protein